MQAWYKAIEQKHIVDATSVALSTAVNIAMEVGERYAEVNQKQCRGLEDDFMGL